MQTAHALEQTRQGTFVLWLLTAASFVVSLDSRVITPLLPAIAEDFDTTIGRTGLIVTAYLLPYGLFQLMYGPLADRVGRVRVVAFALGGFALGATASAFAGGLSMLVLFRLWTGLTAAAVFPLTLTYIGDIVPYEQRPDAIGRLAMASSLGQALSNAVGGVLASIVSWRAIFAIDGFLALVITCLILRVPHAPAPSTTASRSPLAGYGEALRDRRHILFFSMIFVEGAFTIGAFSFFGALLRDRDGYSFGAIGMMVALFGLSSVAAGRVLGRLVRALGESRMVLTGGAGIAGCFVLATVEPAIPVFLIAMIVLGIAFIMLHTTLQTRASELAPGSRATGISLFAFSLFLGSSAGALLVASAIDTWGYDRVLYALAAITAAFTILAAFRIVAWSRPDET